MIPERAWFLGMFEHAAAERAAALGEIGKITWLRLTDMVAA